MQRARLFLTNYRLIYALRTKPEVCYCATLKQDLTTSKKEIGHRCVNSSGDHTAYKEKGFASLYNMQRFEKRDFHCGGDRQ